MMADSDSQPPSATPQMAPSQMAPSQMAPSQMASPPVEREAPVLLNYIITSVMMVCVAAALTGLVLAFIPTWSEAYLLVVCFLVSFETLYTMRATRRISFPSRAWFSYRGAELVAILILLKLLVYAMRGFGQLLSDIQLWQQDFMLNFFTGEYLVASLVVILVWALAHTFNTDLLELEADDATLERERRYEFRVDRPASRRQLMLKVMLTGAGLVAVTVVTRAYLRSQGEAAAARVNVWNLLVYVFLGLLLLSQTRLSALRASWYRERATIGTEVSRRWVVYSILFLIVVAAIVSVLPTRYSLGLLTTLGYLIGWLVTVIQAIVYLVLLILSYPIALLMRLLGQGNGPSAPEPPPPPPPPPTTQGPAGPDPLLEVIKSVLFWAIFLLVIGYSLVHYLGRHRTWLTALRSIPVLNWLARGIAWLWQALRRVNRQLASAIDAGLRRMRPQQPLGQTIAERARLLNLRRLSPRERVQFFYLAMVRRGGQRGMPRKPSQTPYEYASSLESAVPGVDTEIKSLTDSFAEARYSLHDVTPERAGIVQTLWERIKAALRRF